ncbi:MAG: DCC1-like thiol-disulfide oxidoreductase family protein [Pseudomonadota bacterium]
MNGDSTGPGPPDGRIILIMDGDCALCSWGARTIARHDRRDVFRIATVQSAFGQARLIEQGLDPADPDSWLLLDGETALTGSDAVIAAGRLLSGPWPVLAALGAIIPRPVREPLYRFMARNRIAWFGRGDLCALPDESLRAKLIER